MENNIKDIIFSGFYGLAIGDALGVPIEFYDRDVLTNDPVLYMREFGTHNQPKGTWSDDTSMSLATLKAFSDYGLSYEEIMNNFVKWYYLGEFTANDNVFDIGITTKESIYRYKNKLCNIKKCGLDNFYDNGNGSLMRMLPVCLYLYFNYLKNNNEITEEIIDIIYDISSLTHAHILSKMSCVYYVIIGLNIIKSKDNNTLKQIMKNSIEEVEGYFNNKNIDIEINKYLQTDNLLSSMALNKDKIKSSGFVVHSLEASAWCLFNTSSYKDAVLNAVNLGEDTDTIGAIVGSLAGIYYGINNIPDKWIKDLKNKELIDSICLEFYKSTSI